MVNLPEADVPDVGVIVGRFQTDELHEGHEDILDFVAMRHDKFVVVLGNNATQISTAENPLDYQAREQMIKGAYPEVLTAYIEDMWSDKLWSTKLDRVVRNTVGPGQSVMLYGSRDSFIDHYSGKWPTTELEADKKMSASAIRKAIRRNRPVDSADFRKGAIWAADRRYPTTFTTVDIAVFSEDYTAILLGRKPYEDKWRLCGGFAEPTSPHFEADARREVMEELNIEITDPVYIASFHVPDWRYMSERDKIKTILFGAKRFSGAVVAGDDIEDTCWFKIVGDKLEWPDGGLRKVKDTVMPNHIPFVVKAIEWAKGQK
jgi:bifunctional NMN adenylyltransferase/nudix hydrolase